MLVWSPHIPIDVFWRVYLFDDGPATAGLLSPSAAEVDVITSLGYPRLLPPEVANFVSWSNPSPQYRTESQPVLWTGVRFFISIMTKKGKNNIVTW